ncbi:putative vegetative incompatibility protein HET-E-1 [Rosellinia necatrix]|uniref:Putative vegetative incompatibility protein HET-E-1 n=1 Tax=Rosellinia necatrix TaxID=77044 RepID=A0A1W2TQJ1_ROSNE|nr:putative vegetative incompatibility protein HET-E-1 [Rosellinia necatrix]
MAGTPSPESSARNMGSIRPTGITVLYAPSSPVVDICFVHGFTGHPERTWRSKKRTINAGLSTPNAPKRAKFSGIIRSPRRQDCAFGSGSEFTYWPRDLLPGTIPDARTLTFGYDTNIRHALNGSASQNGLEDHAIDFLSALEDVRQEDSHRPLIFVAHSLGGLLVKDLLRVSKSYQQDQPDRYHVYESTASLFFFGTPHAGAEPRNSFHRVVSNIAKAVGFKVNEEIIRILMPGAERTKMLAEGFRSWTTERDWRIYTFQEELVQAGLGVKIVEDQSSSINDRSHERIVHIRADHVDMCRFTGADDPEFCKVASAFTRARKQISVSSPTTNTRGDASQDRTSPQTAGEMLPPKLIDEILSGLSFDGIDARYTTVGVAKAKTCQWLPEHRQYKSWIDPSQMDTHHGLFWIKGKPGTGKSFCMKHLYQKAAEKKDCIVLKFFFNARGRTLEHSTEGMYRSLLWQLIMALRGNGLTRDSLDQLTGINTASWGVETLKEALSSMLTQIGHRKMYCFVDALDECPEDEIRDMIHFFEDVGEQVAPAPSNIRVCFSSRHYPHITLRHGLQLVLEDEIDHSNDIRQYISCYLNIDHNEQHKEIENEIFERSSEIFLWAVLVVNILNKENDKGNDISVRRLREIPQGLHNLFKDILTRDKDSMDQMVLCIQWILFAKRPLRPEELYFAVKLGISPDTPVIWDEAVVSLGRINRFNLNASKGLAELTKKDTTVQFIHESVRDYLLLDGGLKELLRVQNSRVSFSEGASHNILRDICLKQVQGGCGSRESTEDTNSPSNMPFLEYAVTYILAHADSAQSLGLDQSDFLSGFPLGTWIGLDNGLQKYQTRCHSIKTSLLYLLAEKNMGSLIRIHPERHYPLKEPEEKQRFSSPLVAAIAFGSTEAFSSLILGAAEGSPDLNDQRCLDDLETELRKMPRFKAAITKKWRDEDVFLLLLSLDSHMPLDVLWNKVLPLLEFQLKEVLGKIERNLSLDFVKRLMQRGARPDAMGPDGSTALERAVAADLLKIAELLLAAGADPNIDKRWCGFCLGNAMTAPMAALLIQNGAKLSGWTYDERLRVTLIPALMTLPSADVLRFLRPYDGSCAAICAVVRFGGAQAVPMLRAALQADDATPLERRDRSGRTPLIHAAEASNLETARVLGEFGLVDIDAQDAEGRTALLITLTSKHGTPAMVQYLLELGADPNLGPSSNEPLIAALRTCDPQPSDRLGEMLSTLLRSPSLDINPASSFPLHYAIRNRSVLLVRLILSHPLIDVNRRDGVQCAPLLIAVKTGNLDIIRALLSHPFIDVNKPSMDSYLDEAYDLKTTISLALVFAVKAGNLDIIRLLLSHHAIDVNLSDPNGHGPLTTAVHNRDLSAIRLLLSQPSINVRHASGSGDSPYAEAIRTGDSEIIDLFVSHLATTANL